MQTSVGSNASTDLIFKTGFVFGKVSFKKVGCNVACFVVKVRYIFSTNNEFQKHDSNVLLTVVPVVIYM